MPNKKYAVERKIRGQTPDVRLSVRQQRCAPSLLSLKVWLEHTLSQVSVKSGLAKAIKYLLTHWRTLARYCEDGQQHRRTSHPIACAR
ncbi:transposase IS66 family protein [Mycetohabitans endofungorum]|uniref:Transposase IS66 family protein n=1 Tax=Mycetohabitans endofungorum TaxID=417203 RepID=A0A2P5K6N5_9BURK|nr:MULTISPECIES: transposase [Mycetohabitans]PPB80679.1 transposase IS66 family protein [Mycetohabitans endofungorum]